MSIQWNQEGERFIFSQPHLGEIYVASGADGEWRIVGLNNGYCGRASTFAAASDQLARVLKARTGYYVCGKTR